jgi:hypothetical protein
MLLRRRLSCYWARCNGACRWVAQPSPQPRSLLRHSKARRAQAPSFGWQVGAPSVSNDDYLQQKLTYKDQQLLDADGGLARALSHGVWHTSEVTGCESCAAPLRARATPLLALVAPTPFAGEAVMMGWEAPLMLRHAELLCSRPAPGGGALAAEAAAPGPSGVRFIPAMRRNSLTAPPLRPSRASSLRCDSATQGASQPQAGAPATPPQRVLNVGFGLGIVDTALQVCAAASVDPRQRLLRLFIAPHGTRSSRASLHMPLAPRAARPTCAPRAAALPSVRQSYSPAHHVIVEAHPDVLAHMAASGWTQRPGVRVLAGRW